MLPALSADDRNQKPQPPAGAEVSSPGELLVARQGRRPASGQDHFPPWFSTCGAQTSSTVTGEAVGVPSPGLLPRSRRSDTLRPGQPHVL